ncbi:MAG: hypothetical protein BWY15_00628 [Firmicutes bacterium ADurb.Bin193]|nr:MAG: hypothetical protein BWY15_00628 [Firmicutes bacterium ADurb.Bin193]
MFVMHKAMEKKVATKIIVIITVACLYIIFLNVFGVYCPIRWATGIPCPACGMTRSFLSLLKLDFIGSFYYHPLAPTLPFLLWAILFGKNRLKAAVIYLVGFLFFMVYIIRLWTGQIPL